MTADPDDLGAWLEESRAWAEAELERSLAATERPQRLDAAVRHAVFGGGKRLRPALVRLVCAELGGSDAAAAAPAAGVELLHTYSLVHDDLPCMDDDDLRRGRPTVHVAFDEATAVLAGDALLTLAFEVLAGAAPPASPGRPGTRVASMVAVLARAAGGAGMVGGQVLDLELPAEPDAATVRAMHAMKTAALFSASAELGALAAGAGSGPRAAAADYGRALGLCFQATDDLLDVTGDAATLGKTPGKDARLERGTLVAARGLAGARETARALAEEAREAARSLGGGPGGLAERLVDRVLERRS